MRCRKIMAEEQLDTGRGLRFPSVARTLQSMQCQVERSAFHLIQAVAGCNACTQECAVQSLSDNHGVLCMVQNHRNSGYGGAPQQHEHLALHPLQVACTSGNTITFVALSIIHIAR